MKRAAIALRWLIGSVAAGVGIEGAFLLLGTVLLAVASTHLHPAGPLFVVGGMSVLAGLALAIPPRKG